MSLSYNGRQVRRSCETTSKKMAEDILCKVKTQVLEGKFFEVEARETTYEELCQLILDDYRINSRKTADKLGRTLKHLDGWFSGTKASEITTPVIKSYIVSRQDAGAANATINREMAALKRMFNLGMRATPPMVLSVPYILHLKENNARSGYFSHHEYLALKEALPSYFRPVVTMAYYTGMRKNEILGLRWPQVDLKEAKITLTPQDTKNGEGRAVFMAGELLEAMRFQKAVRDRLHPDCQWVFFTEEGKRVKYIKPWRKACKETGLIGKYLHDFRRTAVRNMVRAGVPERVAMMVSGHKTRSVFDRYNIVNEADLRTAAKRVQERVSTILAQSAEKDVAGRLERASPEGLIH